MATMSTTVTDCSEQKPWQFKPGQSGNPTGRPKGTLSGRSQALAVLDKLMSEAGTLEALESAWRKEFEDNPTKFFRQYVMPLLPQERRDTIQQSEGIMQWTSLAAAFPIPRESEPEII